MSACALDFRAHHPVHHPCIPGGAEALRPVFETLRRIEDVDRPTVLVTGESGTGKELVARAIHQRGPRRDGPFVVVDCTAIPEPLVESELFGHERGAFTDAREAAAGLLETARGGTVFFDEIGEMPVAMQARLLHALETRRFRRVGGTREMPLNAAVIAATNRDLDDEMEVGGFRADLYFRLAVVLVHLPPLRERVEDIPLLVAQFIAEANRVWKRHVRGVTDAAMAVLRRHLWPGNVRELRNAVEQAIALESEDLIEAEHLPREVRLGLASTDPALHGFTLPVNGVDLEAVERSLLAQAIHRTDGNKTAAARLLGVSRAVLRYRLNRHGLMASA